MSSRATMFSCLILKGRRKRGVSTRTRVTAADGSKPSSGNGPDGPGVRSPTAANRDLAPGLAAAEPLTTPSRRKARPTARAGIFWLAQEAVRCPPPLSPQTGPLSWHSPLPACRRHSPRRLPTCRRFSKASETFNIPLPTAPLSLRAHQPPHTRSRQPQGQARRGGARLSCGAQFKRLRI